MHLCYVYLKVEITLGFFLISHLADAHFVPWHTLLSKTHCSLEKFALWNTLLLNTLCTKNKNKIEFSPRLKENEGRSSRQTPFTLKPKQLALKKQFLTPKNSFLIILKKNLLLYQATF